MSGTTVGLRLDEETRKRLASLAEKRDRTPHYLMKAAIETYLEKEEALENERDLIKARWARFELTGEALDHEAVTGWLNSLSDE